MAVVAPVRQARARADVVLPVAAITLGCLALASRPNAWRSAWTLVVVGAIGMLGRPILREQRAPVTRLAVVTGVGVVAFVAARTIDVPVARPFAFAAVAMNVLAAVAEEAFFRRFAYGWLARWGVVAAITGSTVLFALVHVPQYGAAVLPIDLAAGALLGWQRWASGSWAAPAVTHPIANLLQMG